MDKNVRFVNAIKENEGVIYKITSIYTDQLQDQKDLYQEIVYQLWKSFDSFRGDAKLSTWIYRIALNTSITYINKLDRKVNKTPLDFHLLNVADEHDEAFEERLHVLRKHIKLLNTVEKGIILLYLEGKNHLEIAEITGFSKTNIGTRIGRIKDKLRFQINNQTNGTN